MEMMFELIYVNNLQCPRCGKIVHNDISISGVDVSECERCGTLFKNHVILSVLDDEHIDELNMMDNN